MVALLRGDSDLAAWISSASSEEWARTAAAAVSSRGIKASELLACASEAEAAALLGIEKFGPKRKLWLLLKPSVDAATAAQPLNVTSSPVQDAASPHVASAPAPGHASSSSAEIEPQESAGGNNSAEPQGSAGGNDSAEPHGAIANEAYALGNIQWVGEKLDALLSRPDSTAWASAHVAMSKMAELRALRAHKGLPGVHIVVCGNTGAGKSTLLNALLGETAVLPTNGMRACTACLIEMAYDETDARDAPRYRGEVEFLTEAEWKREMEDLLDDLTNNDGPNAGRVNLSVNEDAPSYSSWCKLWAVYGEAFTHSRERTDEFGPGNRRIYRDPLLDSLKAKLLSTRNITSALSSTRAVTADAATHFKRGLEAYMDSTNEVVSGSYWPIVKRVRMYSRAWSVLRTGAVLVDAPGIHDDNSARDAVVKAHLKDADAVWIVSNIVRAVNDKTAKDMLGEQFRRQLLMDGHFGSLAFVATHSDVLQRSEAVRSLHLSKDATLRECALARNQYTARRLRSDFVDGLRELAEQAGDRLDRAELAARGALPVFTVSAVDFQKLQGLRPHDGPPAIWQDAADTQIPSLVRHVQRAALERRKVLSRRRCEAMVAFGASLTSLLEHEHSHSRATRDAAKAAFDGLSAQLQASLRGATATAEAAIKKAFDEEIAPQLKAGAAEATRGALAQAQRWGLPSPQGGLHWATYKATCRRNGVFRINFNQELVNPIFMSVSTHWERAFVSGLGKTLDGLQAEVHAHLTPFHTELLAALQAARVADSAADAVQAVRADGLLTSLRTALGEVKEAAQRAQRDLSREMEPVVTTQMTPGYSAATAEAGTGSHRRRVALLEGHVQASAPSMFREATGGVVDKLEQLHQTIGQTLEVKVVAATLKALNVMYMPLWDEVGEDARKVRRQLAPKVKEILLEATNAVRLLDGARPGAASSSAGAAQNGQAHLGDDDEVMDVTEATLLSKRERQADCAIDLDANELEDENSPLLEGSAAQGSGPPMKQRKMLQAGASSSSIGGASTSASADAFIPKGSPCR